ncbi:MAG: lamin tail domain-containing protein [Candidatus Delongbacteria bacterium]
MLRLPLALLATCAFLTGPAGAQTLLINEFLASNNAVNTDEFGDHDDWAELWNHGAEPVDLGGLWLSDGGTPWQIPTGSPEITTVSAGGFVILWFDEEPDQGPLHVDDKLGASGESVVLYAADGSTELDRRDFDAQTSNISEGRQFDGSQVWVPFSTPTPGASNGQSAVAVRERPAGLRLLGAAPNPFNPSTTVEFELARAATVSARIHDLAGREVWSAVEQQRPAGRHHLVWQPEAGQASGVYFLTLRAGSITQTQKLLFVQ